MVGRHLACQLALNMFAGTTPKKHSSKQRLDARLEHVKGVLEHLSLYVGLAIYTAVGAKVTNKLDIEFI